MGPNTTLKLVGQVLGAILVIVGSCITWISASGPDYDSYLYGDSNFGYTTMSAGGLSQAAGHTGVFTLVAAILLLLAAAVAGPLQRWLAPAAAGGSFLVGLSLIVNTTTSIGGLQDTLGGLGADIRISIGAGLWLVMFGGLAGLVACALPGTVPGLFSVIGQQSRPAAPASGLPAYQQASSPYQPPAPYAPPPAPYAPPAPGPYGPPPATPYAPPPATPYTPPMPGQPIPAQAAPLPQPATGWRATHRVPQGGLPARRKPDPTLPILMRIAEGVQLMVTRQQGEWALVQTDQGWKAWVDGRRLEPIAPETPQ